MTIGRTNSLESKKIQDSTGQFKTLLRGLASFVQCDYTSFSLVYSSKSTDTKPSTKKNILFLGLSYAPSEYALALCAPDTQQNIYYIEYADFQKAFNDDNEYSIPDTFKALTEEELLNLIENSPLEDWDFYFYKQNLQLFPAFWSKLLYTIEDSIAMKKNIHSHSASASKNVDKKSIFLASFENDLLFKELSYAIQQNDFDFLSLPFPYRPNLSINDEEIQLLKTFLKARKPSFFLSINGRFLDGVGRVFYLLEHLKIPVALWIVDNVWNILSSFKSDFWKSCPLFVTDKSFIPELKNHGAKYVYYLPLAGDERNTNTKKASYFPDKSLFYVGHSEFKNRNAFFAAVKKDAKIIQNYQEKLESYYKNHTPRPQFNSIYDALYPHKEKKLWPANDFREISYIAAELDRYNKVRHLEKLDSLVIAGDSGWKELLPKSNATFLPSMDYYTELQSYYAAAPFTLNIPSLIMPDALTQRHFDLWLAHGFLISLETAGMEIFDTELAKSYIAHTTEDIQIYIEKYSTDTKLYDEIKINMRDIILKEHLYTHRLKEIETILLA